MDFSYLNEISEGDQEFIKEFIDTFEANNELILTEMQSGLLASDFDKLRKLAHQLKPTIEMLGMQETLSIISRMNNEPETTNQKDLDFVINMSNKALLGLKNEYNLG